MANIQALTMRNAERWAKAKLTRGPEFTPVAKRLVAAKERYSAISRMTGGVPWFVIAVAHEREASQDFTKSIAQGDPWNRASIHVPKGRGPFPSFEAAAVDALTNCAPYAGRWKDWTSGGTMTLLEQYNGLGYANKGLPSPYIWAGTDQYVKGKYVADGVFDPNAVDKQLGCAGLLMAMQAIDPTIHFADSSPSIVPPPPDIDPVPLPKPKPIEPKHVAVGGSVVVGTVAALQAGKIEFAIGAFAVGVIVALAIYFFTKKGN